jgi:hypothetical protein
VNSAEKRDPKAAVSLIALQLPLSPMRVFTIWNERRLDVLVRRLKQTHLRKQHRSAIFGGIDQHLDGKAPFLTRYNQPEFAELVPWRSGPILGRSSIASQLFPSRLHSARSLTFLRARAHCGGSFSFSNSLAQIQQIAIFCIKRVEQRHGLFTWNVC